jgi:hypothetical protein
MEQIEYYVGCNLCYEEKHTTLSMQEYGRIEVGKTASGIVVRCLRHDALISYFPYDWSKHASIKCKCEVCDG